MDLYWSIVTIRKRFANILYYDYISYGMEKGILQGHKDFPEMAMTFYPEHSKLFVKICEPPSFLSVRDFNVKLISVKKVTSMPVDIKASPRYQKIIITKVGTLIGKSLNLSEAKKKPLNMKDHPQVDFIEDYNVDDLSYTVWRAIVDTSFERKPASTWWMRAFEILKIPQPAPPPLVNLIVSQDMKRFYLPSEEFCGWFYEQHLINLFIYIHKHLYLLFTLLSSDNPNKIINDCQKNMVMWHPKYNAFRILINSKQSIRVMYKPMSPLTEVLDNTKETNFKRFYIDDDYWQKTICRYYSSQQTSNMYDCVT